MQGRPPAKFIILNTKLLVSNTQFLVINTKFLVLNAKFLVFTHIPRTDAFPIGKKTVYLPAFLAAYEAVVFRVCARGLPGFLRGPPPPCLALLITPPHCHQPSEECSSVPRIAKETAIFQYRMIIIVQGQFSNISAFRKRLAFVVQFATGRGPECRELRAWQRA